MVLLYELVLLYMEYSGAWLGTLSGRRRSLPSRCLSTVLQTGFTTSLALLVHGWECVGQGGSMTKMLMLLVIGGILLALSLVLISSVTALATEPRSRRLGFLAWLICPETKEPTGVRIGVGTRDATSEPEIVSCERFPSGAITCDRACLHRAEQVQPWETTA